MTIPQAIRSIPFFHLKPFQFHRNKENLIKYILLIISSALVIFAIVSRLENHTINEIVQPHNIEYQMIVALVWIVIMLSVSKVFGLLEQFKFPLVLSELLTGIFLGNLYLVPKLMGYSVELFSHNEFVNFLAMLGGIILLFQLGLESNIADIIKAGTTAFVVSILGIVASGLFVFVGLRILFPFLDMLMTLTITGALTSTSAGISASVYRGLSQLHSKEAQISLSAAVIDDILGLIILAILLSVIQGGVEMGNVAQLFPEIGLIIIKSISFIIFSVVLGQMLCPFISSLFQQISTGVETKFVVILSFGLGFASIAKLIGLEPIIGAFAGGLVLDPVHFRGYQTTRIIHNIKSILKVEEVAPSVRKSIYQEIEIAEEKHIEHIISSLGMFLVPIFFIHIGMSFKLEGFLSQEGLMIVLSSLVIFVLAFLGKFVAGFLARKKGDWISIGLSLVPRGEVSLIFIIPLVTYAQSQNLNTIHAQIILVIVLLTSLVAPIMLTHRLGNSDRVSTS